MEFLLTVRLPRKRDKDTHLHFDVSKYVSLGYLRQNLTAARGLDRGPEAGNLEPPWIRQRATSRTHGLT